MTGLQLQRLWKSTTPIFKYMIGTGNRWFNYKEKNTSPKDLAGELAGKVRRVFEGRAICMTSDTYDKLSNSIQQKFPAKLFAPSNKSANQQNMLREAKVDIERVLQKTTRAHLDHFPEFHGCQFAKNAGFSVAIRAETG